MVSRWDGERGVPLRNDEGKVNQRAGLCVVCLRVLAAALVNKRDDLPTALKGAAPDGLVVPGVRLAEPSVRVIQEGSRRGVERDGDA